MFLKCRYSLSSVSTGSPSADTRGRLGYAIFHEELEPPRMLISAGDAGINPLCIPREECTSERKCELNFKLQLQAEERGVVSIKGVCANRYLAMKEDGRLLASKCVTDECFFFERLESNNYNTYRSRKYSSWYVALKRTGQYKLGPKTGPGQKAILFLPMSAKS
ncbi:fibroblast growth factor 2 isoform X1 [Camelus dromedarius]|uniref:fibroblast growth factor 2 isoform X1 n=1 Tax=Camelus dromedarius TaxID=9838 RepID=UPI0023FD9B48